MAGRFDPMLAVHTSDLEPLPHQIQAVYGELIQRTPLRFLLADDPGAGKTIMAGLYIKELMLRGDLERCLIVAPGGLVEQWQDELREKFGLTFELLTRQLADAEPDGNVFTRHNLLIARMDQLSRSDEFKEQLERADWDLVVVDEAHRMSAHYFGNELKKTKRYQLGELLGRPRRHFLLMTATPHAGREEDFQLFLALLDTDRFEGRYRDAVHTVNTDGLMRRMVKEDLKTFEGKPLFPERRAYTVAYELSDAREGPVRGGHPVRPRGDEPRRPAAASRATRSAASPSASRSPSCSGAWRPAPRRSSSRWNDATSAWRSAATRCATASSRRRTRTWPAGCATCSARTPPSRPERRRQRRDDLPGERGRGDRVRGRRRRHRGPHDRRARQGTRDPRRPDRARPPGPAQRHGQEVDRAARAAHRQHADHRREDHHLHRAPRHPGVPRRAHPRPARPPRRRRHHPRRGPARGTPQDHGAVHPGHRHPGPGRDRRRRRGPEPAARPPDGQLRPAVEPEPDRAALRPHPPHRPDRGLPPVEPRRRPTPGKAWSSPSCSPRSRSSARPTTARSSTCSARRSRASRCATCSSQAIRYGNDPKVRARLQPGHRRDRRRGPGQAHRRTRRARRHVRRRRPGEVARADGRGERPPPPAALHQRLLRRGVQGTRRPDVRTRVRPLRDPARPRRHPRPRPPDRHQRRPGAAPSTSG